MIAANEILSGGRRIVLMSNGERFRRQRKTVHTHLQPKAVETYKDTLFECARILILDLLDDSKNHQKLVHRYVSIYSLVFVLRIWCALLQVFHINHLAHRIWQIMPQVHRRSSVRWNTTSHGTL